ncbi:MAG: patatin-like phospholipase family protein [Cyanobacteria bacterium J06638_7]
MKRILSLDGGGIRGLIPALVLAAIESKTGKPVAHCFDLIAGTSTGGILALGFSRDDGNGRPRYTANDLAKIYRKRGKDIFSRSFWKGVSSVGGFADELYSHDGLEAVLEEYFGEDTLGSCLTDTLITSYDIQNRRPLFFKSWKAAHSAVLCRHAARATSAAPTFFEPARVTVDGAMQNLVDGGVFMNSPSVSAYTEARRLYPGEDILVVSIGTGELVRPIDHREARDWGRLGWLLPLLSCMFDGVADAADYQMSTLLGERYIRLQTDLTTASDDMDDVSNGNIENLTQEARKLMRSHKRQLEAIVQLLAS